MGYKLPYVKLGTMPFGPAVVKYKRVAPKVGEIVEIKEADPECEFCGTRMKKKDKYNNPWIDVRVDMIRGNTFFVSKM